MHEHHLVIASPALDDALEACHTLRRAAATQALAIGHAVPDTEGNRTTWRAASLQAERFDPQSRHARRVRRALGEQPQAALLLVDAPPRPQRSQPEPRRPAEAPDSTVAWQAWLDQALPAYRLLCAARDPDVIALWLGTQGQAAAALRQQRQWAPVASLAFPGPGMQRLQLATAAAPQHAAAAATHTDAASGRYSRLAGALGADVLARWQACRFAIVGVGRTGSLLAHSLARSGASLVLLDPDIVHLHNLCGDLLPQHEGLTKADAVARFVRPLLRPGSTVDARALDVAEPAAGQLLAHCDVLVSCVDDDRARWWAAAWASALLLPHLDIGVEARLDGSVGADVRLVLPGRGCLACVGGFARPMRLPVDEVMDRREDVADFRTQRAGSLRSWAQMAGHQGLRLLELMIAGRLRRTVFRQIVEAGNGELHVRESVGADPRISIAACALCASIGGTGRSGIAAGAVQALAALWRASGSASSLVRTSQD